MALLFEPRLKMLGDPFISFQFAFEATDVFETAIRPSCHHAPVPFFGVPNL
jgi:hypothetical protein